MIVFDGNMKGDQHKIFNELVLESIGRNNNKLLLMAHESSSMKKIRNPNYTFKNVPVISPGGINNIFKPLLEFCCLFFAAFNSCRYREQKILILSLSPVMTFLVFYLAKLFQKTKFIFFHHGELEYIKNKNDSFIKPGYWVNKSLMSCLPANVSRVVLSEHIKEQLEAIYLDLNVDFLEHPVLFNEKSLFIGTNQKEDILLGIVGELTKPCVREQIKTLLKLVVRSYFPKRYKFMFVGRVDAELSTLFNDYRDCPSFDFSGVSEKFIPDEVYSEFLDKIDGFFILYPKGEYNLTASGVFAEIVSRNKKFISLDNDYFKTIHKICPGGGYIIANLEEVSNVINTFTYSLGKKDIDVLKKRFSLDVFSRNLDVICSK